MTAAVQVVGGVDPHADTVSVAVLTAVGKVIGDAEFATDADGYARAVEFLTSHGLVERVGVEGAASYGAGISRALTAAGISAVEVERPTRSARRRAGKSDRLDAYHAARAVLAERSTPVKDAAIGGLRALHLARRSAVKARTATSNQMKAILVMAPEPLRARFRGLDIDDLVAALLRCRGFYADPIVADTIVALKVLAERHRSLGRQISTLTARIDPIVTAANPALRAAIGVGPQVAAQLLITAGLNPDRLTSEASFAALCGVAPASQPRRAPDRAEPNVPPPAHHRLPAPADRPRTVQERDPAAAETRDLPRDLPATHPALPDTAMGRPATSAGSQRDHPDHRRPALRRLARHHLHP